MSSEALFLESKQKDFDLLKRVEEKIRLIKKDKTNSFISLNEKVSDEAKQLLKQSQRKDLFGFIAGIKDAINVKNMPLTCASKILQGYISVFDADAVKGIKSSHGLIAGKNNMDEFCCGSTGENSCFDLTKNPVDLSRVAGGSSSGVAAAVKSGLVDFGIGSDTGGSIRAPASFCGVASLKPSYGLVSRYGLVDFAMSLESPAPIAKDVFGVALLMNSITGIDSKDAKAVKKKQDFVSSLKDLDLKKARIGLIKGFFENLDKETDKSVNSALKKIEGEGIEFVELDFPDLKYAIPAYYLINYVEGASSLQKFDGLTFGKKIGSKRGINRKLFGKEVKRRIIFGTYVSLEEFSDKWYSKALIAREKIRNDFQKMSKKADLILGPTMPFVAPKIGEIKTPVQAYQSDLLTVPQSLAGIPAGVIPLKSSLPVGLQITGFDDLKVLQAMHQLEGLLK